MTFTRKWRVAGAAAVALVVTAALFLSGAAEPKKPAATVAPGQTLASEALGELAIKPAAPHTGYSREQFADGWVTVGGCDMREQILNRDLVYAKDESTTDCTVLSGTLHDPYTGKTEQFKRGADTSSLVQIDHVVALSDAWVTGAQNLSANQREQFYNDPLELLAVDGQANDAKSDGNASTWLPPNKSYDCRYVARQIAVKIEYHFWTTAAEHAAMRHTLASCPSQPLPVVGQ